MKKQNKNPIHAIFEYHQPLFMQFIKGKEVLIRHLREEPTKTLVNTFLSIQEKEIPMTTLEGIICIKSLQRLLENEIKTIVSTKGISYWFHLYRRTAPGSYFANERPETVYLYRSMMECAFLKYGQKRSGKELLYVFEENKVPIDKIASGQYKKVLGDKATEFAPIGTYLGEFDFNDFVEMASLERLVYEYWHTTTLIRRLYKVGEFVIQENGEYYVDNTEATDHLIKIYDDRNRRYGSLATTTGIPVFQFDSLSTEGMGLLPRYNFDLIELRDYPIHRVFGLRDCDIFDKHMTPNFLWLPFDFRNYYECNLFLATEFENSFGFSWVTFVLSLFLVAWLGLRRSATHPIFRLSIFNRAYHIVESKKFLLERLKEISKEVDSIIFDNLTTDTSEMGLALDEMTLKQDNISEINLTTRGPRPLLIPADDAIIIDFAAIPEILKTQTHFIRGEIESKGSIFTEYVQQYLTKNNIEPWIVDTDLKYNDGSFENIDIAFFYNNLLFMGEIKCINISFDFEIGNIQALKFRKKKLKKAIAQIDRKAAWLSDKRIGTNYEVPSNITVLIPFVITPFVEYIWSSNAIYWLTQQIPRVCIVQEIKELLGETSVQQIIQKPYIRYMI